MRAEQHQFAGETARTPIRLSGVMTSMVSFAALALRHDQLMLELATNAAAKIDALHEEVVL